MLFERMAIMDIIKKKYKKPELEAINFEDEDIITCSGMGGDDGSGDDDDNEKPPIGGLPIIPI